MARKTTLVSLSQISEINMTPLMDLTFILLITFIITFPLIEQGVPVNLPKGKAKELDEPQTRSISMDRQQNLYLDDAPISQDELQREMNRVGTESPEMTVYVRADEQLPYGKVAAVLKLLYDCNITRTALVMKGAEGAP